MMRRLCVIIAFLTLPMAALAEPKLVSDPWVKQLKRDGYGDIRIERTFLGRVRIVAERDEVQREIVLNRSTGEVLRDYSKDEEGGFRLPAAFEDDDRAAQGYQDDTVSSRDNGERPGKPGKKGKGKGKKGGKGKKSNRTIAGV